MEGGGHEVAVAHRHNHALVLLRRRLLGSEGVLSQHLHAYTQRRTAEQKCMKADGWRQFVLMVTLSAPADAVAFL